VTANLKGRTSTLPNEYSQLFIAACATITLPVLDIGAAFGVATLPALSQGATVIANDIDEAHLEHIARMCPPQHRDRLTLLKARFPDDIDLSPGSLGAVHASNLFNFLTPDELERGMVAIARWLAPGGRLFAISGTPYAKNVMRFIPEYERRRRAGERWPGYVTNLQQYAIDSTLDELPPDLHLLDDEVLGRVVSSAGLSLERIEMFERANLPSYIALDGRENVGVVAVKTEPT
jgi:polyketide synthase PksL